MMNAYDEIGNDLHTVLEVAMRARADVTDDLLHTDRATRQAAFDAYRTICNAMMDLSLLRETVQDSRQSA